MSTTTGEGLITVEFVYFNLRSRHAPCSMPCNPGSKTISASLPSVSIGWDLHVCKSCRESSSPCCGVTSSYLSIVCLSINFCLLTLRSFTLMYVGSALLSFLKGTTKNVHLIDCFILFLSLRPLCELKVKLIIIELDCHTSKTLEKILIPKWCEKHCIPFLCNHSREITWIQGFH